MKTNSSLFLKQKIATSQKNDSNKQNWIDISSPKVLRSKNKLSAYYLLNKQKNDNKLENYFQKKILKTGNDQDFQKILLKQLFNWSDDTLQVKEKDIEIIVSDNFKQSQYDDDNFEFEEINLEEENDQQNDHQNEKVINFLQQNTSNFIQQQYEQYRKNFQRIDYTQSSNKLKTDFNDLKLDNDILTEQSFVVSQSKYSNDQNESFDEDLIDEDILSVSTTFTSVKNKGNFGGFHKIPNTKAKIKTLKTCSTQCSAFNNSFVKETLN